MPAEKKARYSQESSWFSPDLLSFISTPRARGSPGRLPSPSPSISSSAAFPGETYNTRLFLLRAVFLPWEDTHIYILNTHGLPSPRSPKDLGVFIVLSMTDITASVTPPSVVALCCWLLGSSALGCSGLVMDLSHRPVPPGHQDSPAGWAEVPWSPCGTAAPLGQHESKGRVGGTWPLLSPPATNPGASWLTP